MPTQDYNKDQQNKKPNPSFGTRQQDERNPSSKKAKGNVNQQNTQKRPGAPEVPPISARDNTRDNKSGSNPFKNNKGM